MEHLLVIPGIRLQSIGTQIHQSVFLELAADVGSLWICNSRIERLQLRFGQRCALHDIRDAKTDTT